MSTKSPCTFMREFKFDLCRQVKSGQKRPAQLCRELRHHRAGVPLPLDGLVLRRLRPLGTHPAASCDPPETGGWTGRGQAVHLCNEKLL